MKIYFNKKLFTEEDIFTYLTGLIFLSLYFVNSKFVFDIGVKITIADIVIFGTLILFLFNFFRKDSKIQIHVPIIVFVAYIFFILIVGLDIRRVSWPARNFSLLIMCLRNIFLMIVVSDFKLGEYRGLKIIVNISIVVSVISSILYFFYLLQYPKILLNQSLWHPGIWYFFGESSLFRLSGLGNDPNFFGAINGIGFIFCLFLCDEKKYQIGATLIFLSIILTFSRTLFIIGTLVLIFSIFSFKLIKSNIIKKVCTNYFKICIFLIIIGILFSVLVPSVDLVGLISERMKSGIENISIHRFQLWSAAISAFKKSPLLGQGGRYIQMTEGNYVHNDYLEILSSYGLLGFFVMVFFLLGNLKLGILSLTNSIKIGAYILLVIYMIFMMEFTIFFNPYIYFIIGLLWGNGYKDEYLEIGDDKLYGKKTDYYFSDYNNLR